MKKQILLILLITMTIIGCKEKTNLEQLVIKKTAIEKEIKTKKKELTETIAEIEKINPSIKTIHYPAVSVIETEQGLFEHFFDIQGAIDADKNIMVTPEMGGKITSLPVKKGQYIRKGETIATFDTEIIASNRIQLEEQLSTAKYMYDKQKRLFDKGVSTEIALKQA